MDIDQLPTANPQKVNVYMPYYQGNKRTWLPKAMSLYEKGVLEGHRKIEGGENIPFVATWNVAAAALPSDLTRCRLQFDGNAELSYEITLANNEFINFLIEVITNFKSSRTIDFPKSFYRRLLRLEE